MKRTVDVRAGLEWIDQDEARTFERIHELPLDPWASGKKSHRVRLVPERITGRRVGGAR